MMNAKKLWHNIVNLPIDKLPFVVAKYSLSCEVDLIHDTWIFTIELQKYDAVLFNAYVTVSLCVYFDLFFVFELKLNFFGLI